MDINSVSDDALFSVLKDCKTLPNFLDAVFGFLKRRTDFYCIATTSNSPIGLPAGYAEYFTKQAFRKWQPKPITELEPLVVDNEVEVTTTLSEINLETPESTIKEPPKVKATPKFNPSESYNGATFDNYSWSQSIGDLDIIVKIPDEVSPKNLLVNISSQKIEIKVKNSNITLLEGELCHKVKHNDALWSVDEKNLEIHLEKTSEIWWNCLVQSEPKLDVAKIDCSRPFEELPDDAQAKIEELTWNQERKRLGLPTSDELLMQERLKKAWNVEGSPFQGPYDPNTVILN